MSQQQTALRERTDEELIDAFQRGEDPAYSLLVGRYKDRLVNFACRFMGDFDAAEEVAQETFIRVFRHKHLYKPVATFSTWIYAIAANLARSELRRRRRHLMFSLSGRREGSDAREIELPDETNPPDAQASRSLEAERIRRALEAVPAKFREVAVLFYIQDLSYEEICGITGMNMGTVKSRLNRARARLQELLKESGDDV